MLAATIYLKSREKGIGMRSPTSLEQRRDMSHSALILLHPGFEELEAIAPIDLMSRAGIEVTVASTSRSRTVDGRSDISVKADTLLEDVEENTLFDAVILPGGPGINAIRQDPAICKTLNRHYDAGKWVAAICAAPLILKDAGILTQGMAYTAFPATNEELPDAQASSLVRDGTVITSRGAGTATEFGLGIIESVIGTERASEIANSICWPH